MKKINQTLKEKILAIFTEIEDFKRALVPELAFNIEWGKVGEPVSKITTDENGNETSTPIGQGEFATADGIVVTDESSNLVEVRPLPAQPADNSPEVPAVSGETSGNTQTSISGATAVADNQSGPEVPPVSGVTSGDTASMAAYPWEQCISDQTAKGISQEGAQKICGWIKANNSQEEMEALMEKELSADDLACVKKKKMEDIAAATSGATTPAPASDGLNKTIKDLCPNPGDYVIQVCVDDTGAITEATVTSQKDLLPSQEGEMKSAFSDKVKKLFARVIELEAKMKEPIAEPILAPETPAVDFAKMSQYEKLMYKKGLKAV